VYLKIRTFCSGLNFDAVGAFAITELFTLKYSRQSLCKYCTTVFKESGASNPLSVRQVRREQGGVAGRHEKIGIQDFLLT